MEKFDWKQSIQLNNIMLKICGLWPEGDDTYKLNFYTLYSVFIFIVFVCGHNFFQSFNIVFLIDDLEAVTTIAFVSLTEMLAILKSCYIIYNMKVLKHLMITLRSDMFQPTNSRQIEIITPSLRQWKLIYYVFSSMTIITLFFRVTYPVLDKSFKDHQLPILAWYPWNVKISPLYELTYLYQAVGVFFVASVNVNGDALIAALNMCIGAQCDILCDNLRRIHEAPDINNRFISCIRHHKAILKFTEDANSFFNWIVFMQFFVSATSIGITMFQLTVVPAFSTAFYSCLFYETAITVQIFMYCWFGNEVGIKSSKIPYAVYESLWMGAPTKVRKNLIYFVLRCQRPIKVSAMNLFYLSLETFVKILRTSYSYFAVLNHVNAE